MSFKHLRTYRAIQLIRREGSIRKAAEILAISPSALNRSILALEDDLGIEIFDRLPGGVAPSVAGELLFRHLDEHISRMDDFVSLIAEMRGGAAGRLRLTMSADLTGTLMPSLIDAFRRSYPGIAVEASENETLESLLARDVDLALVTRAAVHPECREIASTTARVVGCVGKTHPSAGKALSLSEIADHALIMPPLGTGLNEALGLALRRRRIEPRARHVWPRPLTNLSTHEPAELQPVLDFNQPLGNEIAKVDLSSLRLPAIPVTAITRRDGHLPRAVSLFISHFQR